MAKENSKIAERAYYKYLERGGEHGRDMNDWLEAEKELTKGKNTAKKPAARKTVAKRATAVKKSARKS